MAPGAVAADAEHLVQAVWPPHGACPVRRDTFGARAAVGRQEVDVAREKGRDPSDEEGSERLGGGRDTAAHAHSPLVAVRLHRGHAYLCCGGNVALALCGAEDVAENGDKYYFDSTHTSIYNCFELVWGDPAVDARRVEGDWRRAGLPAHLLVQRSASPINNKSDSQHEFGGEEG